MNTQRFRTLSSVLAFAVATSYLSAATAAPLASGSAYDVSIHLSIAGIAQFDVAPFDTIAFSDQATAWSNASVSTS